MRLNIEYYVKIVTCVLKLLLNMYRKNNQPIGIKQEYFIHHDLHRDGTLHGTLWRRKNMVYVHMGKKKDFRIIINVPQISMFLIVNCTVDNPKCNFMISESVLSFFFTVSYFSAEALSSKL